MLNVFYFEFIILIVVAILVQLPIMKSYKTEHTYKIIEGMVIVIMHKVVLINVFISSILEESCGVLSVVK